MTLLALVAFLEMLLYMKKKCLLKALFISLIGAVMGYILLTRLELGFPLTRGSAAFCVVLGLPGTLLLTLIRLLLPVF